MTTTHKMRATIPHGPKALDEAADEIDRLTAENARLRRALKFYVDPAVYKAHPHGSAFDNRDLSFVARFALTNETET